MTLVPLVAEAPRIADSIRPHEINATTIWLTVPDVKTHDGRLPIVYVVHNAQN